MSIEMILDGTAMNDDPAAARRKAFVDAARELFFANGYAGTTMSSIASKVGGSKTTLWSYFPSKEDLFAAVVDDLVDTYGQALRVDLPLDEPVTEVLVRFGRILMGTILSPPILALHRLVVAEAERFPHLAELFYERGPRRGKARLALWMAEKMERGELRRGEPMQAVYDFTGLCQGGLYQHALLGLPEGRDHARIIEAVDAASATFFRGWAPRAQR